MKQEINSWDFQDAFRQMDRQNQFTYDGQKALFNYLEDYENDTGESIELDVIALCCEYTEYENMQEFIDAYGDDYKTIEDIEYQTSVIMIDDESFIIQDF